MSTTTTAVRDLAGRAGTLVGAAALVGSLFSTSGAVTTAAAATGVGVVGLAVSVRPWRRKVGVGADAVALYLAAPGVLAAEALTFAAVPGVHWGEALAGALWLGVTWRVRPSYLTAEYLRRMAGAHAVATIELARTPEEHLVSWWADNVGCEDGAAPGTRLTDPVCDGPRDFRATVVAPAGQPVPDIPVAKLSALTDIPPELIRLEPVPGRGTRYKALIVATTRTDDADAPDDLETLWATRIAPAAMPRSVVTAVRYGSTKAPGPADDPADGGPDLDTAAIAAALTSTEGTPE